MIKKLFDAETQDLPPFFGSRKNYVLCTSPRTGSNLLCELLGQRNLGVPMEYFHIRKYMPELGVRYGLIPDHIEPGVFEYVLPGLEARGEFSMTKYLEALKAHRTTKNGVFGFKAHLEQFVQLWTKIDASTELPGLHFIYLSRKNKLAQAVSFSKAVQMDQWDSLTQANAKAEYREDHIQRCITTMENHHRRWIHFFEKNHLDVLRLSYEDFIENPTTQMRRIVEHLGVDIKIKHIDLSKTRIKPQRDHINQEWIARFLEDNPGLNS